MKNLRLLIIFLIVFIALPGFSLILAGLPYPAESYGATPVMVGLLVASYAAAQLTGAPLLGPLSDRISHRPVLAYLERRTGPCIVQTADGRIHVNPDSIFDSTR